MIASPLSAATERLVDPTYRDASRQMRESNRATVAAIRERLARSSLEEERAPLVLRRGSRLPPARAIVTEEGVERPAASRVPRELEFGYHRLITSAGERALIVSPGRCHLPADTRGWGWAVQLYAARSRDSWGMGDLADLRALAAWSAERDARFILVNPLHAALPLPTQEPCPYFASSRQYRSPLYLRIEEVPGSGALGSRLDSLRRAGLALNAAARIDRDAVWRLKLEALEGIWKAGPPLAGFDGYVAAQGPALQRYSCFCALTEVHGAPWQSWPVELRRADGAAVAAFAAEHADRLRFHSWIQWLIAEQLERANQHVAVMQDLAIGVDPSGADCWSWGDAYASGFTVGAPPDRFNTQGQNWAQPPFDPVALRALDYRPFIEMLRASLRPDGALRFDHVMGLFRLWWIPDGAGPDSGAYVRYPSNDLLDILALESMRARAIVVGEDLGTVEAGVRPALHAHGVLSYRLLIFGGDTPPERFPVDSLTALTTHDLPTLAGLWDGSDLEAQRRMGLHPNERGTEQMRRRVARLSGLSDLSSPAELAISVHQSLARVSSRLVAASLEDAALTPLRPNMPGTTSEAWPNWQIPLPHPLEEILASSPAERIAAALRRTP